MYVYGRAKSVLTPTGIHSKVNTLTETTRKPSLATRVRDLIAGDSGFTLLETLAVMVIVGLLAAITVPQISKWREKAYVTALKTDARNVANAIEASYVDNQSYPTPAEFTALVAPGSSDVKLNPGNTTSDYARPGGPLTFSFKVNSTKTTDFAWYRNYGSPTITINK